jgi:hypothetical protein
MEKIALLLIPETNETINRQSYISACVQRVIDEGYTPLTPAVYEHYTDINVDEFISNAITKPDMNTVFLFVDFGIDKTMFNTIDRCIAQGIELKYIRLQNPNLDSFYTTPHQVLKDVSRRTGVTIEALIGRTRQREIVDARFVYFRRCRELSKASLAAIGLPVGRDHASVLHGIKEANNTIAVLQLYEKCYGATQFKKETMGPGKEPGHEATCAGQIERPVLPYNSMDKREQNIQGEKSIVHSVSCGWTYGAFNGYRPHNS